MIFNNQLDIIYKVPEIQTGTDFAAFTIIFWGGPINIVYIIDEVVLTRIDQGNLPAGHPVYDPIPPPCNVNMFRNGDGYYETPFRWDAYGHWFSNTTIDAVPSDTDPSNYILVATNRTTRLMQNAGLGQILLQKGCIKGYQFYVRIQAHIMLYDPITRAGITSCSPENRKNCPYLKVEVKRPGFRVARQYFYDDTTIEQWKPNEWNYLDIVISVNPDLALPEIHWLELFS